MRGLLVQLDEAVGVLVGLIYDGLALLELEEGGPIYLAYLALRRPELPDDSYIRFIGPEDGWARAEELSPRIELPVDLEAYPEAEGCVIEAAGGA